MIHWHLFFFLLFGLTACVFALAVVFTNNVVRMAFYLVLSLGATAGLFFLAGADFVGAMQLMIYVGGTLVLLVFGVMLTAQSPFISMKTRAGEWIASMVAGGLLLWVLLTAAFNVAEWRAVRSALGGANGSGRRNRPGRSAGDGHAFGAGPAGCPGRSAGGGRSGVAGGLSGYLLPFEIVSVHLLVVLVGAAYLARPKKRMARVPWRNRMNPLAESIGVAHYLVVGAVMFVTGAVCMATKRNALGVLMGIELVLNGANINFVAFGSEYLHPGRWASGSTAN